MLQSYTLLGALGILSIEDIKEKKITVSLVLLSAICGICMHLFFQTESIFDMLQGMLPGLLLLLVCACSHGKIGLGDGLLVMLTGLYLGWEKNIYLLFWSVILTGLWAIILLLFYRKEKTYEIPFAPFLFAAYLGMIVYK